MFSIYGKAGRVFRGSMEELRKVGPAAALGRTQKIRGVARDGQGDPEAGMVAAWAGAAHSAPTQDLAHRGAMAAYEQASKAFVPRHPLTLVRDIMNTGAMTLPDDASVASAWDMLTQHRLGQAPVVNPQGTLVGLVSRADLMRSDRLPGPQTHALVWQAFLLQSVQDVMWTPVPSVAPETDIRRLARVLLDTGLPGLPVLDEQGAVVAFVSRTDILRAVVSDPPLDLWS
jgi:CBS domain-containing protein